jgi:hypothetical protein
MNFHCDNANQRVPVTALLRSWHLQHERTRNQRLHEARMAHHGDNEYALSNPVIDLVILIAITVVPTTIIVLKIAVMLAYAKAIRRAISSAGPSDQSMGQRVWEILKSKVAPIYQWLLETMRGPGEVIGRAARKLAVGCAVAIAAPFLALWSVTYMVFMGLGMCFESVGLGTLVRFGRRDLRRPPGTEKGIPFTVMFLLRNVILLHCNSLQLHRDMGSSIERRDDSA